MNIQLKPRFSRLLRRAAWKQRNGAGYSQRKDKAEVSNKGKYKQEKMETSYKKQKKASAKQNNTQTISIVPKSTMIPGRIGSGTARGLVCKNLLVN